MSTPLPNQSIYISMLICNLYEIDKLRDTFHWDDKDNCGLYAGLTELEARVQLETKSPSIHH